MKTKYINGRLHVHVLSLNIMGSDFYLTAVPNEGIYVINSTTGNEIEISLEEAKALQKATSSIASDFFNVCEQTEKKEKTYLSEVADTLDKDRGVSVFTDTTTINNALHILDGYIPFFPDETLDFSTFAFLVVMFDKIFVDSSVRIPTNFSNIIFPVDIHNTYEVDYRYQISPSYEYEEYMVSLENAWSEFLGESIRLDYKLVDKTTNSPSRNYSYEIGHMGNDDWLKTLAMLRPMYGKMSAENDLLDLSTSVSIQTWRYIVNEKIAEILNLPYYCTCLRYPVEKVNMSNKLAFVHQSERLITRLSGSFNELTINDITKSSLPNIYLPHPLSIIMSRSKNADDIIDELLKLRKAFKPIREILRKADDKNYDVVALFNDGIKQSEMPAHLDGILNKSTNIATAFPLFGAQASAMLKIASDISPISTTSNIVKSLVRPNTRILRSFNHEISHLNGSLKDFVRLWGEPCNPREWLKVAVSIGNRSSTLSAKLLTNGNF